jgi:tetratricopeptide (TPR) repeat protein
VDLGELYFFFKNDLRSAEFEALEAIRLDNDSAGAHLLLARLSIAVLKFDNQNNAPNSQTMLDRATSEYEAVTRLDPSNAEAWALLTELYRMKNDTAKQVQALEALGERAAAERSAFYYWLSNSELTPDQALSQLSQVYLSQGRKREALDAARAPTNSTRRTTATGAI